MDSYDKCRYSSLTDYIVQAILAYKEPIITGEEQLRRVLREELSRNRGKMPVPAAKNHELQIRDTQERHPEEIDARQKKDETERESAEELRIPMGALEMLRESEKAPDMDETTIAFMKEMGIM